MPWREKVPERNDYRNPIVAEAMKEMKYVNMLSQGVKRVQDILRENGNKEAAFDVSKLTVFCVEVYSNEEDVSQDITNETTQKTTQSLSNVQVSILEYVQSHPNASRKEIAAGIDGITEDGVKYHLQKLQNQGILKRIDPDKGGHWEIV